MPWLDLVTRAGFIAALLATLGLLFYGFIVFPIQMIYFCVKEPSLYPRRKTAWLVAQALLFPTLSYVYALINPPKRVHRLFAVFMIIVVVFVLIYKYQVDGSILSD